MESTMEFIRDNRRTLLASAAGSFGVSEIWRPDDLPISQSPGLSAQAMMVTCGNAVVATAPSPSETEVISQYDYTYDAAGRRIEIARSGGLQGGLNQRRAHYWLDWGKSERVEANVPDDGRGVVFYHRNRDDNVLLPNQINDFAGPDVEPVVVNKCNCNVDEFHRCLTERAEQDTGKYTYKLCHEYVDGIVGDCLEKQRRKERR
jgi:hypothetical protein